MRQVHLAGEKVFIDYSGKKPCIWDRTTGEAIEVELFVAVLGASNYTYAEATRTQTLPDFCASTVRAFEYFGCTPKIAVPDQLRSAVSGPDRYDPEINPTYAELSEHYQVAIIPARTGEARDKAKVETGVLIAQRWILACLRNRTFFSLDELNAAIAELLEKLNTQALQEAGGLPALRLRDHRPPGDAAAARDTVGVRAVEEGPREHRLPRRLRRAALQRPVPPRRPADRPAHHHFCRGDLPARQAGRQPRDGCGRPRGRRARCRSTDPRATASTAPGRRRG